jgi:hypothetical protein
MNESLGFFGARAESHYLCLFRHDQVGIEAWPTRCGNFLRSLFAPDQKRMWPDRSFSPQEAMMAGVMKIRLIDIKHPAKIVL